MQIAQLLKTEFLKNDFEIEKTLDDILSKFEGLIGAKIYKSCRSRQELANEYLVAKCGFGTAENESSKVCHEDVR